MQQEENKTVDIDTTGPAMDVDIAEEKDQTEVEQQEVQEDLTVRPVVEETANAHLASLKKLMTQLFHLF